MVCDLLSELMMEFLFILRVTAQAGPTLGAIPHVWYV